VKYGINAVAVVFNDEAFGNVARDLDEAWGGSFAAELKNPDCMKLADAYGVAGLRAEQPSEVGEVVRKALALNRPALVEVRVGRMGRPAFFAPLKTLDKYRT
jgi:acetolactate synthase-1/2/3 large subunit